MCPSLRDFPQNFSFTFETSLLGQIFIFGQCLGKTVYGAEEADCYKKNFAGYEPPVGLRDPHNLRTKYICQKDYPEFDYGTHYGTMVGKRFGIPVYSAYTLTEDNVDFKEWPRPKTNPRYFFKLPIAC